MVVVVKVMVENLSCPSYHPDPFSGEPDVALV